MANGETGFAGESSGEGESLADVFVGLAQRRRENQGRAAIKDQPMDPAFYDAATIVDTWFRVHECDARIVNQSEGETLGRIIASTRQGLEQQAIWFGVHRRNTTSGIIFVGKQEIQRAGRLEYILVLSLVEHVTLEELESQSALEGLMGFHEKDKLTEIHPYDEQHRERVLSASGITISNRTVGRYPTSLVNV